MLSSGDLIIHGLFTIPLALPTEIELHNISGSSGISGMARQIRTAQPAFCTFARILVPESPGECLAYSLTNNKCEALLEQLITVIARCDKEGAGRDTRLRRTWLFYKAVRENELATQRWHQYRLWDRPNSARSVMCPLRATAWKKQDCSRNRRRTNGMA